MLILNDITILNNVVERGSLLSIRKNVVRSDKILCLPPSLCAKGIINKAKELFFLLVPCSYIFFCAIVYLLNELDFVLAKYVFLYGGGLACK